MNLRARSTNREEPPTERSERHRVIGFASILALAMMMSSIWIYVIGALAPFWVQEFDISRTRLGSLTFVLYTLGAVGSIVAGRVVDILEGRRVLAGMFLLAMLTTTIMALAPDLTWIYVATVTAGIGIGCGNPATNKLISRLLPSGRQGGVMGIKQAGVQVGAFATGAILPAATLAFGWRQALLAALTLPIVGLIAALRTIPHDGSGAPPPAGPDAAPMPLVRLTGYAFLMGSGVAVIYVYLPLYAFEDVGVSVTTAGSLMALIGLVSIAARLAWGYLGERFTHMSTPLMLIAAISIASTASLWLAGETDQSVLLWIAAVGFGSSATAWNVVGMLAVVAEVGTHAVGRASGIVQFGFFGGFILTPLLFGSSVDATGGYGLGWGMVFSLFVLSVLITYGWHPERRSSPLSDRVKQGLP